eukprot:GHVT01086797.1.p1 GENE.GHVT01086797.1~~GHVT01086797.1.p1  ORF type:complete len:356 (-),score=105.45 GHVT01086797.1:83-1012(-)
MDADGIEEELFSAGFLVALRHRTVDVLHQVDERDLLALGCTLAAIGCSQGDLQLRVLKEMIYRIKFFDTQQTVALLQFHQTLPKVFPDVSLCCFSQLVVRSGRSWVRSSLPLVRLAQLAQGGGSAGCYRLPVARAAVAAAALGVRRLQPTPATAAAVTSALASVGHVDRTIARLAIGAAVAHTQLPPDALPQILSSLTKLRMHQLVKEYKLLEITAKLALQEQDAWTATLVLLAAAVEELSRPLPRNAAKPSATSFASQFNITSSSSSSPREVPTSLLRLFRLVLSKVLHSSLPPRFEVLVVPSLPSPV